LYADFPGVIGESSLFIDEIIHQAFVDVDEVGTGRYFQIRKAYR
jgi:serine protease inhibitor